jgi:HAD superfamily hydrolase (TIGR01509 family)
VRTKPEAVIFDLDGVLIDSEPLWNGAKKEVVESEGGRWRDDAPKAMIGMSSPEWSSYMHDQLGVPLPPADLDRMVVQRVEKLYRAELPLIPGVIEAVRDLQRHWPLGLASSANREVIDLVLALAQLTDAFKATVSSEEVERGKPAPDVYLEAARRLGVRPDRCVAIEDSSSGLRSAAEAGMAVIAVPNPHYPPDGDALALAAIIVPTVAYVTPEVVRSAG